MRLGLLSPLWPPKGGGGEVYLQRIGIALAEDGVEVAACTGTAAPETAGGQTPRAARTDVDPDDPAACAAWLPEIAEWLAAARPTHLIVNAPFTRVSHGHAAAVYALARARGCRIAAVHLDLDRGVVEGLAEAYAAAGDWEGAARIGEARLGALAATLGEEVHAEIGSPLHFDVDGVIACSDWSGRFVDPLARAPRLTVHPPMGEALSGAAEAAPTTADFGFVNPRRHKGGPTLAEIVRRAPATWRFRALQGGHGSAFRDFAAATAGAAAGLELIRRVDDMRAFYDGIGALLVASTYEGYGMVAVEAMLRGTPVVARDYPAIREAVGEGEDAGALVVPFAASTAEWLEALAAIRAEPDRWRAAAAVRVRALAAREAAEIAALRRFLRNL
ncbi:glycosyltransferase family 4 protein [Salinarimonas sp.]|uniref:glycosyltransferase family 4 protein n=1 Tax=Salinarimonas sp. TaxID=2766526 RepID=UPI0032D9669F